MAFYFGPEIADLEVLSFLHVFFCFYHEVWGIRRAGFNPMGVFRHGTPFFSLFCS